VRLLASPWGCVVTVVNEGEELGRLRLRQQLAWAQWMDDLLPAAGNRFVARGERYVEAGRVSGGEAVAQQCDRICCRPWWSIVCQSRCGSVDTGCDSDAT